mmetsp:Transcript_11959/g.23084  ORF Transcript_11959/g.23084 Transcript_11959/m.23084 type:complete len:81 (+) Transcript_11959:51-293(+)
MGLLDKLLLVGAGGGAAVWYYTKGITDCTVAVLKQQGTLFQTVQKPGRHAGKALFSNKFLPAETFSCPQTSAKRASQLRK